MIKFFKLSEAAKFGTIAVAALGLFSNAARSQTSPSAVTDPVGFLSISLPASSDTYVSIPFTRPVEFTGAVTSVATSGTAPNTVGTITFSAGTFSAAGQFAPLGNVLPNDGHKTYYVIIGPKNVALSPTLSVTNASSAVTASSALPADLAVGDTVTVSGYTFTVAAIPTTTTLTLDRAYPGASASGLAATYNHSPSEGRTYTVNTNDTSSLTVNLNGDSLANVASGTQVSLIPYWTFATLFPSTDASKSFLASTGTGLKTRGTQILIPDLVSPGTNLAASLTYYFYNGSWRQVNDPVTTNVHDDDVFLPDTYLIVRNISSNGVAAAALSLTSTGSVLMNRESIPLHTQTSSAQDNFVGLIRPTATALNDLGLITSKVFTVSTGTGLKTRGDQLFILDNNTIGINKAGLGPYYYYNNAWRNANDTTGSDVGSTLVPAAGAVFVRKAATSSSSTAFLQNPRNYLD